MKKTLAVFLASLMLTTLLIGCAQTKNSGSANGSSDQSSLNKGSDPGSSVTGGTSNKVRTLARFPIGGEITTLINGDNSSTNNMIPIELIHDRFVASSPDGVIGPSILKDWKISEDGMVYTFKFQDGVTWHDGSPLTAEDIAFSIELFRKGSYVAPTFGKYVSNAEIIDDKTVAMHMKAPYSPVLSVMSRDGYVYSKHHYEVTCKGDYNVFNLNPCGTGPYKYVSYKSGQGMTLQYNENYWNKNVLPKNPIKTIELRIMTDTNAVQTALETDSLDFAGVAISVPQENYDYFRKNDKFQVTTGGSTMTWYLPINTKVWNNQTVRQALAYALDRKFLIELLDAGNGKIANTLALKKAFGWTDQKPYDYDVKKAKALLEEAGFPNGKGLPEMQIVSRPDRKAGSEALQSMWNEIGIKSRIDVQEATTYLSEIKKGNYGTSIISTTVSLDIGGNINDFSDPANGSNWTFWYDPNVYGLLESANSTVDASKRMDYFTDAFTKIREVVNHIYLFYDTKIYVHRANLVLGPTYLDPPALRFFDCYWLPEGQVAPPYAVNR